MTANTELGPVELLAALRDTYFRYYDTPFRMRSDRLNLERRDLLDRPGGVWQEPLLEVRPAYKPDGRPTFQALEETWSRDLAELATAGLLADIPSPYSHQTEALDAFRAGQDFVVTAGTGSGKTETFMLPMIGQLLRESESWTDRPEQRTPWWTSNGSWSPPADGRTPSKRAAVRVMILYPMNALVDDQLVRLRRALDSDEAHVWLDEHRSGNRFRFGRYTGGDTSPRFLHERAGGHQTSRVDAGLE